MENILTNPGLIDIREQIFGQFDLKTLKNCREVFAKKFGEEWDLWLERLIMIQCIVEFGDNEVKPYYAYGTPKNLSDSIPGWDKAAKKFGKTASLDDLNEVKGSLKGFFELERGWLFDYANVGGHVKLMKLLFLTDLNINDENNGFTPFTDACLLGPTEIVNLMVTSSKEYGIDLNACDVSGETGFDIACQRGHTEIVKLMIENRAKYGINIKQEDKYGCTALDIVNGEIEWQYLSEKKKATFKELKHMLEEAYLEDNEPQPTI